MEPDANAVTMWVACAAVVLVIIDRAFRFWKDHIREQPRPSDTYATIAQHNELKKTVSVSLGQIDDRFQGYEAKLEKLVGDSESRREKHIGDLRCQIDAVRRDVRDDVVGIHKRVDVILEAVAEVRGQLKKDN